MFQKPTMIKKQVLRLEHLFKVYGCKNVAFK